MEKVNRLEKKLYLVLWCGAAVIISMMLLINHRQKLADEKAGSSFAFNGQPHGDEMTISAKNSFINLLLRGEEEKMPVQVPSNPKVSSRSLSIYYHNPSSIVRPEDFSIGPVPK